MFGPILRNGCVFIGVWGRFLRRGLQGGAEFCNFGELNLKNKIHNLKEIC